MSMTKRVSKINFILFIQNWKTLDYFPMTSYIIKLSKKTSSSYLEKTSSFLDILLKKKELDFKTCF